MSPKRAPSAPPDLHGFDFVKLLGSGGFADVFLYQQRLPRRRVAVKVLLADKVAGAALRDFTNEANLMAQLSTHPSIVTIYEADVSRDGRPYLVMEYCPKPNLQVRYRKGPFSVAEALRIGIQVAGAVETAHRAGILHRDIKPANILVTEYNRPALTDFGISGSTAATESLGMSIPWSPPESFAAGTPPTVQSDVFALAATVYTLLAGRSPFEIPGEANTSAQLISRIQSSPLSPLGRADVPITLLRVFETAMAKSPSDRYPTALDFARALQKIEIELKMSVTPVDVLDDSVDESQDGGDDDGRTRVRGVVSIDPTGPIVSTPFGATGGARFSTTDATLLRDSTGGARPVRPEDEADDHTQARGAIADATVMRAGRAGAHEDSVDRPGFTSEGLSADSNSAARPQGSKKRRVVIGVSVVIAIVGGIALASVLGGSPKIVEPTPTPTPPGGVVIPRQVPAVENLEVAVVGTEIVVTWENPKPEEGDLYLWGIQVGGEAPTLETTAETRLTLPLEDNEGACVEVTIRRADGRTSAEPQVSCAP